jgi:phycobilisome core component
VLQGLRETYNSLGTPIAPTVRGIQIIKDLVKERLASTGVADTSCVDAPFDHMTREISERDI